jgi:hypothetical protein
MPGNIYSAEQCDGTYRGSFSPARDPHPECHVENDPRLQYPQRCGRTDPYTGAGWYCTRARGHRGDCVARENSSGRVRVRWPQNLGGREER